MENKALILDTIEKIITKGGNGNFAVFTISDDYYIQVMANKGDGIMLCEAVSNKFLEGDARLSDAKIRQLEELYWNKPSGDTPNFYQSHRVDSITSCEELAELIMATANNVYGSGKLVEADVNLNLS